MCIMKKEIVIHKMNHLTKWYHSNYLSIEVEIG